jgi:hypothetical protein
MATETQKVNEPSELARRNADLKIKNINKKKQKKRGC